MEKVINYLPKVKEQYEEFPYPERSPQDEKKRLVNAYLASLDAVNHNCFQGKQSFDNFRVLIAGGGTGDNTIWWAEQLRHRVNSRVVYLDMSASSTEVAKKRAQIRKLDNIEWVQDSLLNLPTLGLGQFDFIDCCGVLHHLADPDAGLKALVTVLKPKGGMTIMVYARYGRAGIYQMQSLMGFVNKNATSKRQKIENTKKILKTLPDYSLYKVLPRNTDMRSDENNESGIYDLFLHSQDRAYTILEVHDWLERCGMKMAGEPGTRYDQLEYLPETHIKDAVLLKTIESYPVKVRQVIAETASSRILRHEFFAVRDDNETMVAQCTDIELIPSCGVIRNFSIEQIAEVAYKRTDTFFVEVTGLPETRIWVPATRYRYEILSRIDGQRTIREIVEDISGDKAAIMRDFETIFISLNRGNALYLRHPSIEPCTSANEIKTRLLKAI